MQLSPQFDVFATHYDAGQPSAVWATLSADLQTPVAVCLAFADEHYCSLFESVEGGANRGRYSFITLRPDVVWQCKDGKAHVSTAPTLEKPVVEDKPVFDSLRQWIAASSFDLPEALPPMAAGLFGFMGYDMVQYMERLPNSNKDPIGIPEAVFVRPTVVIVFDAVTDEMFLVTPVFPGEEPAKQAYEKAQQRLQQVMDDMGNATVAPLSSMAAKGEDPAPLAAKSNLTQEQYHHMVNKAKEYILAGDIFQVVPSQRFSAAFEHSPFALYRVLRRLNPSPFSFFMKMADMALVGSSPEILVRLSNKTVTVRPIAGTRKRGATKQEDRALAEDLLADPKELAEHLMLVDLGRNDVGRVAKIGSVTVTESKVIEYYSHVMHIVSNVQGQLADDKDALDAMIAGFPVGTVSGAPKIRAMEIIDELEQEKRSFYAGGVGYFSSGGDMDTCITLRTALVKDNTLYVQAGGGVVADSDPEAEYQESCNKAQAILKAASLV